VNTKDQAYADAVRHHVDRLRRMSTEALQQMPACAEARCELKPEWPAVNIYREELTNNRTLIAVQAKREIFLGYGHMFVDGLVLEPDGSKSGPRPEDLYDYT
jgi:hypothetical protein